MASVAATPLLRAPMRKFALIPLGAAPMLLLLWSAYVMWETYSPTPVGDQWINVHWWRYPPSDGWLNYLLSQHNEHRIFFPRLVFLADWKWFEGRDILNLIAIGVAQIAGAVLFIQTAQVRRASPLPLLGLAVALSLLFSLMQWENLVWGFQVSFVGVYALSAWAIYAFCRATGEANAVRWGWMATAGALLLFATLNMANGLFAGAVMALMAMVTRRGRLSLALPAVATAMLLAFYLRGYHQIEGHAPPELALHHPGRFFSYVGTYLGNIWSPGNAQKAEFIGCVGVAAVIGMVLALVLDREPDAARSALCGVAVFVGISAAVTSFGRLNFGVEQSLSSRYMTPTAYFWGAQALFWALTLQRSRIWPAKGALGTLFGVALFTLGSLQPLGRDQARAAHERVLLGSTALLGGAIDEDALLNIYPQSAVIHDLTPFMRKTRISLFAEPRVARIGRTFSRELAPRHTCRGEFEGLEWAPLLDANPQRHNAPIALRAHGWGWDVGARRTFSRIVLVDATGRVLGIGLSGIQHAVSTAAPEVKSGSSGWIGSLRFGPGPQVIAYGITSGGTACELGRRPWPRTLARSFSR